jgi:hypothetical protein
MLKIGLLDVLYGLVIIKFAGKEIGYGHEILVCTISLRISFGSLDGAIEKAAVIRKKGYMLSVGEAHTQHIPFPFLYLGFFQCNYFLDLRSKKCINNY